MTENISVAPKYKQMTKKERLKIIRCFQVTIPRTEDIIDYISDSHSSYDGFNEPDHIYISGETGVGKTTISKIYEKSHPREETDTDDIVPVLRIDTPVPATCKELVTELLDKLGDPKADIGSHNIGQKTRRLVAMLRACQTELIIIDEFQHFIHRRRRNALGEVSDWLKNLTNQIQIPMVLIGLPDSEHVILENQQLRRRFSERYKIEPFGWSTKAQKREFKRLLKEIDNCLPFDHELGLWQGDMPLRFFDSCKGTLGHLIKLIRKAAKIAIMNDAPTIYMETFAESWKKAVKPDIGDITNPFEVSPLMSDADTAIREYKSHRSRYGESNHVCPKVPKVSMTRLLARR